MRTVAAPVLYHSGALWVANRLERARRKIALNYHNVSPDTFEAHARYLRRHCDVVPLDRYLAERPGSRPLVTLTVDDGYVDFVERIVPIARKYGLPMTWFVPTAFVDSDEIFWFDRTRGAVLQTARSGLTLRERRWTLSSWNREYVAAQVSAFIKRAPPSEREALVADVIRQLGEAPEEYLRGFRLVSRRQLADLDSSIAVGSHSHTHPQLSQLDAGALASELTESKRLLEEWGQRPVTAFAFPSGDYSDDVLDAVQAAGYTSAWTTEARFHGPREHQLRLPRVSIADQAHVGVLCAKLTQWGVSR